MTERGERALIEQLTAPATVSDNRAGFASDCAVVPMGDLELVATTDAFAAPTHFPEGTPPRMAARLAAGGALSDLAAAGADLTGALVAYGLPEDVDAETAAALGEGVAETVERHGGEVLGGDTKPRDVLSLVVTGLGTAPSGAAMTRDAARPGDRLLVTGPLGGAGAALARVEEDGLAPREATPLLEPEPRLSAGRALVDAGAACAMDLSDGLADAARAVADASGVRVVVDEDTIPLHAWAREDDPEMGRTWALSTGGDYELLASVPEDRVVEVEDAWREAGLSPARVGRVEAGGGAVLTGEGGERELSRGYEHRFGPEA